MIINPIGILNGFLFRIPEAHSSITSGLGVVKQMSVVSGGLIASRQDGFGLMFQRGFCIIHRRLIFLHRGDAWNWI
jgi:hypothetical protein